MAPILRFLCGLNELFQEKYVKLYLTHGKLLKLLALKQCF